MKKILYLFMCILTSCVSPVDEVIIENNVFKVASEKIEVKEALFVDRIGIYDSLLVVINRKGEPVFCTYDNRTLVHKGSFGEIGNGPDDFQFPFFLNNAEFVDGVLDLYDVNTASFKKIPLNKMLDKVSNSVVSEKMPSPLIGSPNLTKINQDDFIGNIDSGRGLFFMYKGKTETIRWIEFPTILKQPENDFTIMNMNRITVHPQSKEVVSAMGYYNLLFLYNNDGVLKKTIQVGDKEISPIILGVYQLSEDNCICFREIVSTDKEVFVLMQNIKEKNFEKNDNPPSRILVLDWNLNYQKTYELPHYAMTFALDESQNRIIYTILNEEGGTDLYYITLSD